MPPGNSPQSPQTAFRTRVQAGSPTTASDEDKCDQDLFWRCVKDVQDLSRNKYVRSIAALWLVALGVSLIAWWTVSPFDHTAQPPERPSSPAPMPAAAGELSKCSDMIPCPVSWRHTGNGGYFCLVTGGCRAALEGFFPDCPHQCYIGNAPRQPPWAGTPTPDKPGRPPGSKGPPGKGASGKALLPQKLTRAGSYDLRVVKGKKLLGCAAPIGLFPGQPKYGCSGKYATAQTCDAAKHPVKDTAYVQAVHDGCETKQGRGTYGYAYDDGVGLKQCAPVTKYEWVLCPDGREGPIAWQAVQAVDNSTRRFRVNNKCNEAIWIQQAGAAEQMLPHEKDVRRIEPQSYYTYAIPNRGLPSTRFLPKTGCDTTGNNCDVQSMPPCPTQGCDLPIDTKFESSWGCQYATGIATDDKQRCAFTGQGNPSTYQDWWDGSAVDGWTLPFSVLVDDGGHGLAPGGAGGSPDICGNVVCANLDATKLCPQNEFLTPIA